MANFSGKDPREYCISTKRFVVDDEGKLKGLDTVRVEWTESNGKWSMEEIKGSEKFFPCQLVLLALGFLGPQKELINALELKTDPRSNIQSPPGVSHHHSSASTYIADAEYLALFNLRSRCLHRRRLSQRSIPRCLGYQRRSSGRRRSRFFPCRFH